MSANGEQRQQREMMREQERQQLRQQGIQQAFNQEGHLQREYIEAITRSDLDEGTIKIMQNMLSRDFVLSNLNSAEVDEIKWLREVTKQMIFADHPPEDSVVQGEHRQVIFDDETERQTPLSQREKIDIEILLRGAFTQVVRSREGFQQEEFSKNLSVTETRDSNESDQGFIESLFR